MISSEERARRIEERIARVAEKASKAPPVVKVEEHEIGPVITADGELITYLFEADAEFFELDLKTLTEAIRVAVEEAIIKYRKDRTEAAIERGVEDALLWTVGFVVFLFGLYQAHRAWRRHADLRIETWLKRMEEQTKNVVDAGAAFAINRMLTSSVFIFVLALSLYYYVAIVLREFAYTRTIASILLDTLAEPIIGLVNGAIGQIPNLLTLLVIFLITRYLLRLLRLVFVNIDNRVLVIKNFEKAWVWPTHRLCRVVLIIVAVVVAYPYIPGSSTAAFQGISILLGVLVSLGANSIASNLLGGLVVVYKRGIHVGDLVKVGDIVGKVETLSLLDTQIRSIKNEMVSIPNSTLLGGEVINYTQTSGTQGLKVHSTVGIGYEEPQEKIERLLIEAAKKTKAVRAKPLPFVLRQDLSGCDVKYEVNAYLKQDGDPILARSEMNEHILNSFAAAGVQIMTPLYVADPETPKVPPVER